MAETHIDNASTGKAGRLDIPAQPPESRFADLSLSPRPRRREGASLTLLGGIFGRWVGLLAGLAVLPLLAYAELADSYKPIHVDAGRVSQDQKAGRAILEGGVKLTQGTLSLDADNAVMQEMPNGERVVHAEGRQVKFRQKMEGQNVWLEARADKLDYDSKTGEVKLRGNAWVKKGEDESTGALMTYNSVTEQFQAEGAPATATNDGRVRMVIQPKKKAPEVEAKP
ncbi:lipopolysaccharide transport periplasmic protein LptA [Chitinimonas naiadis]